MNVIKKNDFFNILRLLNGLPVDYDLGMHCYNSLKLDDKYITDKLFAKALHYDARKLFLKSRNIKYSIGSLTLECILIDIGGTYNEETYKKILNKII
ncbi:MAG: hypothetical protein GKR90_26395 [Pseudomonadales bacterium]|nr:hypothetical protein [Pseudomonadales bacterium]